MQHFRVLVVKEFIIVELSDEQTEQLNLIVDLQENLNYRIKTQKTSNGNTSTEYIVGYMWATSIFG